MKCSRQSDWLSSVASTACSQLAIVHLGSVVIVGAANTQESKVVLCDVRLVTSWCQCGCRGAFPGADEPQTVVAVSEGSQWIRTMVGRWAQQTESLFGS